MGLLKVSSMVDFLWWMFTWDVDIIILCLLREATHIFSPDIHFSNYAPSSPWKINQTIINCSWIRIDPYPWTFLLQAKWITRCTILNHFHWEYIPFLLRSYTSWAIISWMVSKCHVELSENSSKYCLSKSIGHRQLPMWLWVGVWKQEWYEWNLSYVSCKLLVTIESVLKLCWLFAHDKYFFVCPTLWFRRLDKVKNILGCIIPWRKLVKDSLSSIGCYQNK